MEQQEAYLPDELWVAALRLLQIDSKDLMQKRLVSKLWSKFVIQSLTRINTLGRVVKVVSSQASFINLLDTAPNLKSLTLSPLDWNKFTPVIPHLNNLTELNLLTVFGRTFTDQVVHFWAQTSQASYPELYTLTNLERLAIKSWNFKLTQEIKQMTNLKALLIQTDDAPTDFGLPGLRTLHIESTNGVRLNLSQFSNLTELTLRNNEVNLDELVHASNLRRLDIYRPPNASVGGQIPEQLKTMTKLRRLSLTRAKITSDLPQWLCTTLRDVTHLDLSWNSLSYIPMMVFTFHHLKCLEMISNQITEIPLAIQNLTFLRRLDLNTNSIKVIPKEISVLTNLRKINLSNNRVEILPPEISHLIKLESIMMTSNRIKVIPEQIGVLVKLHTINFSLNLLGVVPEQITKLSNLRQLMLMNNKNLVIPEDVMEVLKERRVLVNREITLNLDLFGYDDGGEDDHWDSLNSDFPWEDDEDDVGSDEEVDDEVD